MRVTREVLDGFLQRYTAVVDADLAGGLVDDVAGAGIMRQVATLRRNLGGVAVP